MEIVNKMEELTAERDQLKIALLNCKKEYNTTKTALIKENQNIQDKGEIQAKQNEQMVKRIKELETALQFSQDREAKLQHRLEEMEQNARPTKLQKFEYTIFQMGPPSPRELGFTFADIPPSPPDCIDELLHLPTNDY